MCSTYNYRECTVLTIFDIETKIKNFVKFNIFSEVTKYKKNENKNFSS